MHSIPIVVYKDGERLHYDVSLSSAATLEQEEMFDEICEMSKLNWRSWRIMQNQIGINAEGVWDADAGIRGILI